MTSNKNQHFVPRCHLRPFTRDALGCAIDLFNITSESIIRDASVRHQCSGNNFYGRDPDLELVIQSIESAYATVVQQLHARPGGLGEAEQQVLKRFWLLQYLRTEAASKRAVKSIKDIGEELVSASKFFKMSIQEAVAHAMRVFVECPTVVDDLRLCVLGNNTDLPFHTSDDPAILANRWHCIDNRTNGGHGLISSGAIALLPLSPRYACISYDADVYDLRAKNGYLSIKDKADIELINEHQFLGCFANVYFKSGYDGELVASQYGKIKSLRPNSRHITHYAIRDEEAFRNSGKEIFIRIDPADVKEKDTLLVNTESVCPLPSAWPSFLGWRLNGKVHTDGSMGGFVRRGHINEVDKGKFRAESTR